MKRTVTSVTLAVGLAFASLAGAATAHAKSATPVAAVQLTAFNRTAHPSVTETKQSLQTPTALEKLPARLARKGAFAELEHPRYNLIIRPRLEALRARRAAQLAAQQQSVTYSTATVSTQGMSAFEACVISRESGGNAQVMNSSGHYGLFQFSYSTWVAAGGSPALFGHASAAYQMQIFANAYRMWGTSPWAPYDGC